MAKEKIKPNEVSAPTIFIGVGGTGTDIVKGVAELCRPEETENISFICLDTDVNSLNTARKSEAHIYYVQTSNTQTVGDYLDYDDDARRFWFPKNAVMYDKTVSEGAGQVRAISRLALNATIKTGKIDPLYEAIDELFRKNGGDMKQALRVVIASTASGGTGSGIILPLAMFVRDYVKNKYPNTAMIIRSLILLPETLDSVITSTQEKESQRRNAYATIKEINAFMMKGSGFFDIDEDLKRYSNVHVDFTMAGGDKKSLALLPMDFCFLMDGQDSQDSTMKSFSQYKVQASRALYEQNIGPMHKGAFSMEDNIIKELSNPGNLGRNRFGGIGASVIRYPYEELADYVAYGWALENIGGEQEAGKWGKYDKAYEVKKADEKKRQIPASEGSKRSEVYIDTLDSATDPFSKDIRSAASLEESADALENYVNALKTHMSERIAANEEIAAAAGRAYSLSRKIDYSKGGTRGNAVTNLGILRQYESAVNRKAQKVADSEAEAIFSNETSTINEKNDYMLESLLKNANGNIAHPVAARYLLYKARDEFNEMIASANAELQSKNRQLELYSPKADNEAQFDVKYTKKGDGAKENSIDALCAVEKKDPGILENIAGYEDIYDQLNKHFPRYFSLIRQKGELIGELAAYKRGYEFLDEVCGMYERFFAGFKDKVSALLRKQDDLVDSIKFVKGDSVLNICNSRAIMDELVLATRSQGNDSAMLDSELNGQIFDAVKANVAFEREIRNADVVEEDKRKDIFDEILLKYFQRKVREDCGNIDLNVVEGLALEYRLMSRIKTREQQDGGKGKKQQVIDHVSSEDTERHIREVIATGGRLASPGIQMIRNEEPREVRCVAYNQSLNEMRNYRMEDLFGKGIRKAEKCDTVSKYEMHFFTALYNLTPDKLNKFAAPGKTETRRKNAGLYYKAYMDYAKYLGPDSTKNMMISTHIDKRWDSIAFLPELDLDSMKRQMLKIHQALVYALVYGAISQKNLSVAAGGKKVFRYENSNERVQDLIVSNGTLCDEFYEILDALYIDASVVEDIQTIKEKKQMRDMVRNSNYDDTAFAQAQAQFELKSVHPGHASLLEIPLAYYNSLPSSQRFTSEIIGLIDAVVQTYADELQKFENKTDAKFRLCEILKDEFALLMKNYDEHPVLRGGKDAGDNAVIEAIFRKIKNVISVTPEPDDYAIMLDEMKHMIR